MLMKITSLLDDRNIYMLLKNQLIMSELKWFWNLKRSMNIY